MWYPLREQANFNNIKIFCKILHFKRTQTTSIKTTSFLPICIIHIFFVHIFIVRFALFSPLRLLVFGYKSENIQRLKLVHKSFISKFSNHLCLQAIIIILSSVCKWIEYIYRNQYNRNKPGDFCFLSSFFFCMVRATLEASTFRILLVAQPTNFVVLMRFSS